MKFKVKGIELYSETQAKITLGAEEGAYAAIYVPVEEVAEYRLGQEFTLTKVEVVQ